MLLPRSAQSRSHHLKFPAVVSFPSVLYCPDKLAQAVLVPVVCVQNKDQPVAPYLLPASLDSVLKSSHVHVADQVACRLAKFKAC